MLIPDSVIESIASPGFLVSSTGELLRINRHGYTLLSRTMQINQIRNIRELDPDFDFKMLKNAQTKILKIGKLKLQSHIYPCVNIADPELPGSLGVLYIIDNILFNADFVRLMNAYEDLITVANSDGVIEFVNNASFLQTGERYGVGTDTHDMNGTQIVNEPITLTVLRQRKPVASRLSYRSGAVLLNRAWPLFKDNGEIDKIAILAQNILNVSQIDERLFIEERQNNSSQDEAEDMAQQLEDKQIIARSAAIRRTFAMAHKVAASDASVFIQGESGVGKEIIAKFIHQNSKRRQQPFISVNCSAIPRELFEAEMFGYEKGAFTGANRMGKPGLFEMANGGTVFLDEIGELPLPMQSKLLRAIQEGRIRRVGGIKDIAIDVRYISATNLSMDKVLDDSYFRRDLYYRLSVVLLMIPPLRERKEDILPLINHYTNQFNKQTYGDHPERYVRISKDALRQLIEYSWPGNIRELRNTVERIVILAEAGLVKELPSEMWAHANYSNITIEEKSVRTKARADNEHIIEVYKNCGSVYETAKQLGIAPSTIYRKIKSGKLVLQNESQH